MSSQNVNLTVQSGGGITHAILDKLRDEGHVEQDKNLSGSVWSQIMNEVKNDASGQYTGGSNYIEGQSSDAKASWVNNFKVKAGQALEFTQVLWNKIVAIVNGEPIKQEQSVPQEVPEETPEPVVPQEERVPDPVEDTTVESTPQEEPQQTVHEFKPIPDGAKQMLRDIVNIDSNTKGNKETVVLTKNEAGTKVYNQVVTDPETGSSVMGGRLIADNKSGKNEFYTVDETIPDGAEVDKKTVDGNKETLNYEIKGEDGKTHRYLMIQDKETGKYQKGAEIFAIKSSNTHTNTNKFVSETELNKKLQEMNVGKNVQELQQLGIEVQQYDDGSIVFKKDGNNLNITSLKALLGEVQPQEVVETPNEPVDNNQSIEITDEIRTRMKNISTAALGSDFKYEFDESGQLKTSGTVSLVKDYEKSGAETIGLMVRSLPTYYNQNTRLYTKFGVQSRRQSIVNTGADNKAMRLIQHQAIYNDLSTKPKSELTDAQKNFMKKHEQDMAKLFQEYDAAKQNK